MADDDRQRDLLIALASPSIDDCPRPWLRYAVGEMILDYGHHGREQAAAELRTLANKLGRKRRITAVTPARVRGQPPMRDIRELADTYLYVVNTSGPWPFAEFARMLAKVEKDAGRPPPFKSERGFVTELGKAVRALKAKGPARKTQINATPGMASLTAAARRRHL